ncbi:hypothetical protein JTB14_017679 [Gonioctena quinquepunctata]|nr:hypothetical protein JTB14_017679 [Gonioctena quinquepunctata]
MGQDLSNRTQKGRLHTSGDNIYKHTSRVARVHTQSNHTSDSEEYDNEHHQVTRLDLQRYTGGTTKTFSSEWNILPRGLEGRELDNYFEGPRYGSFGSEIASSELGKLLERIIKSPILSHSGEEDLFHPSQFGFRTERSIVYVVQHFLRYVREAERHSMGIFADISGAFDNMWWPMLMKFLHERNIPAEIISLMKSYLRNRRLHWPKGVQLTAYADYVAFSMHAPNRRILEDRANSVLSTLADWAKQHKLSILQPKTCHILKIVCGEKSRGEDGHYAAGLSR